MLYTIIQSTSLNFRNFLFFSVIESMDIYGYIVFSHSLHSPFRGCFGMITYYNKCRLRTRSHRKVHQFKPLPSASKSSKWSFCE